MKPFLLLVFAFVLCSASRLKIAFVNDMHYDPYFKDDRVDFMCREKDAPINWDKPRANEEGDVQRAMVRLA